MIREYEPAITCEKELNFVFIKRKGIQNMNNIESGKEQKSSAPMARK